jgi:hypothetical protein
MPLRALSEVERIVDEVSSFTAILYEIEFHFHNASGKTRPAVM